MRSVVTGSLLKFPDVVARPARNEKELWLANGQRLWLRALRPDDRERLKEFFERCSPESIRTRFFRRINEFSASLLDPLTMVDGQRHLALVVTQGEGFNEEIIAEGRAVAWSNRPQVAEVAFLVRDDLQRRGIATRLFDELTTLACRKGFTHFTAEVMADNYAMLALIRKSGLPRTSTTSQGVIHYEIPLTCSHLDALPLAA